MSRDINEYFHEHCDKMFCEECEMGNDQKEEYVCYHQGFYVKGYQQGRADERERIVSELEEASYQETQDDMNPFPSPMVVNLEKAIEIVRGGE